jgi:aconitase B
VDVGVKNAITELRAEVEALRRFKSTNAPRIEALEGLLAAAQIEVAVGKEARATLASERAANALLTAEVEALRADAERHYAAGWIAAAKWAERDDLISDIDSPAYIADRDAAIDRARSKE